LDAGVLGNSISFNAVSTFFNFQKQSAVNQQRVLGV
jgi:hypothetical protein